MTGRQVTEHGARVRGSLLAQAASKVPIRLTQFDGFYLPGGGDDVMKPNDHGWALHGGSRTELLNGGWDVRVLLPPGTGPRAAQALRDIADWIDAEPDLLVWRGDPQAGDPIGDGKIPYLAAKFTSVSTGDAGKIDYRHVERRPVEDGVANYDADLDDDGEVF